MRCTLPPLHAIVVCPLRARQLRAGVGGQSTRYRCPTVPCEVLPNGKDGYLVPVGNPPAVAAGIELALNPPVPCEVLADGVKRSRRVPPWLGISRS